MRLQSLRVDVKIVGHLATTTWDISVFNPQRSVLEGELIFPMGDGQTVSRFAMDVNGALREGVVVEKDKGRQVFEDIVRRNVDPGLLEKTSGNSFRARVYPIPARGSKRVVIAYEQELKDAGTGAAAGLLYHLPLAFTDKVDTLHAARRGAGPGRGAQGPVVTARHLRVQGVAARLRGRGHPARHRPRQGADRGRAQGRGGPRRRSSPPNRASATST